MTDQHLSSAPPDRPAEPAPSGSAAPVSIADAAGHGGRGDVTFLGLTRGASALVLLLMAAIAAFLVAKAIPAIHVDEANWLLTKAWGPDDTPAKWGIAAIAYGTVLTSLLSLLMAVPVAIGVALFITHYAPRRLAQPMSYLVDLLAAVPSVIYGLWGLIFLVPHIEPLSKFLSDHFSFVPIFESNGAFGQSYFTASVVLAIMVLPIIAAISREVFRQVPQDHIEAAYALGATRWEMVRTAVLPYGRSGMIGATVLGFGRAVGETIAIALVLSANYGISYKILEPGGNTIAANIANYFADAGHVGRGALIASGLVLFGITLAVNLTARAIVNRRRDFSGAQS